MPTKLELAALVWVVIWQRVGNAVSDRLVETS